jgi:hypothetical protein
MMKILVCSLLSLTVTIPTLAQRQKIKLKPLQETAIVIYKTKTATIHFRKADLQKVFNMEKDSAWFTDKIISYREDAFRAIAQLDNSKGVFIIPEYDPNATPDQDELALLIRQKIGAILLLRGDAEVYMPKDKKRQEVIEMEDSQYDLPRAFFFKNSKFFEEENNMPQIGVMDMEPETQEQPVSKDSSVIQKIF